MIRKMSHACIYVLDIDEAIDFYTNKLGMDLRNDVSDESFRWVTVSFKDQPELEIVLMPTQEGPHLTKEESESHRRLIGKGLIGCGVLNTDDIHKTYEELKAKGVEFMSPPEEKFYGIEALLKDNSGNWFSLTQHK